MILYYAYLNFQIIMINEQVISASNDLLILLKLEEILQP